jgi:hypothetical protein
MIFSGEGQRTPFPLFYELNHQPGIAQALNIVGEIARSMSNRLELAKTLATLAGTIGASGKPQQAARLFGASARALEKMGAIHQLNDQQEIDHMIAAVHAQLDEVTFQSAWAEGRELPLEQAVVQALNACDVPD